MAQPIGGILGKSNLHNFYGELNNTRSQIESDFPLLSEIEVDHEAYIQVGAMLELEYNKQFNNGVITIDNFTQQDAFKSKLSPFKKAISNRFDYYSIKEDYKEEYKSFVRMLLKTQIILTTNYDTFIEDSYDNSGAHSITKYIGQRGFFRETFDFAELYKLHGCTQSPEDIVLTKNDYLRFEKIQF